MLYSVGPSGVPSQPDRPKLILPILGTVPADISAMSFITICWILAVILVNPIGEFPSVDDWAYVWSVRSLVEHGEFRFHPWTAPNLISQVLWGALFAFPFGVSYTALRVSTLVAALLGALALFQLIRDEDRPISVALFSALVLLFNPIFFALSFTFMTDVPFVAAQTGAMLFLMKGLRAGSRSASATGWILALAALLCRQNGIAIPIAYGGAYLVKHGWSAKRLAMSALPLATFIGLQWVYQLWLDISGRTPLQFGQQVDMMWSTLTGPVSVAAVSVFNLAKFEFFYLGLFLLPVSLFAVAATIYALSRKAAGALVIGIIAATAAIALLLGQTMPIWFDTLKFNGIGPASGGIIPPPHFWPVVTVLAELGGVLLLTSVLYAAYSHFYSPAKCSLAFALLGAASLSAPISVITVFMRFDRYLLPIIPWLALASASTTKRASLPRVSIILGGIFLCGMAWYSVVNVHNLLAEKRVVATALESLVKEGVPRESIDASWIFNGEALYGRYGSKRSEVGWYKSRDYVIGAWREPEYKLLRSYPVPRWAIWGSKGADVFVWRRPAIN
jgi:hypothetical protein